MSTMHHGKKHKPDIILCYNGTKSGSDILSGTSKGRIIGYYNSVGSRNFTANALN
ncbi:hypothetical protein T01_8730 [Trichinella spiralis]|uniref:Uncharacterized protein n=1 Tax=Trichinella spiralis TaxID=6334 RepID=A0A0V1A0U9_TRISP|nr:hypothetical protein T01_8730 [Trichinella spiralis]